MFGRRDSLERLTVRAGDVELDAELAAPPVAVGLVICARVGDDDVTRAPGPHVAAALRARGLATVTLDLCARREAPVAAHDLALLAGRLVRATEQLATSPGLAHLPLGYVASAPAAGAALVASARLPEAVRAVVACGGRPELAGEALARVRAPALFVVGGEDLDGLEGCRAAVAAMTTTTQLAIVPGVAASFDEPVAAGELVQLAGEWLGDHFGRAFGEPVRAAPEPRQFRDRRAAGARLATALREHVGSGALVFGLPRGGVPVADEIAHGLEAPLDVWLVRKLGMPIQPELGMGAIAEGAAIVLDPAIVRWSGAGPDELRAIVHRKVAEIRRRAALYRGGGVPCDVRGRTVILVDDGIATAGALRAAVRGARRRGAERVIVAAPVAAADAVEPLRALADDIVCLAIPHHLVAVGAWYQDFRQVSDDEICTILAAARRRTFGAAPAAPSIAKSGARL